MAKLITKHITEKFLGHVAKEYEEGRLLLIATTNLDARRPVIWNMGAIAASGAPNAAELFRKILRASAAIPGIFPPVMIDVELDGKPFREMHVDGGAMAETFLIRGRSNSRSAATAWDSSASAVPTSSATPTWIRIGRQSSGAQ